MHQNYMTMVTKTHVPLELARYEGEQLISRSQAKRLLLRIEQFKEVLLGFKGITTIGKGTLLQKPVLRFSITFIMSQCHDDFSRYPATRTTSGLE